MFERTSTHVRISKPQATLAPWTRRCRISSPMIFMNLCCMLVISSVLLFFLVTRPLRYCTNYSRVLNLASAQFQHEPHEDDKKSSRGKIVRSMTSPPPYFSLSKVLSRRSVSRSHQVVCSRTKVPFIQGGCTSLCLCTISANALRKAPNGLCLTRL